MVNTADASATDKDVDVPEVGEYCDDPPQNTPSFTVYATVWLKCDDTNPPTAVCTASDSSGSFNCHDFDYDTIDIGPLNLQ